MDLALNNLQWLICHKTKPNHLGFDIYIYIKQDLEKGCEWLLH